MVAEAYRWDILPSLEDLWTALCRIIQQRASYTPPYGAANAILGNLDSNTSPFCRRCMFWVWCHRFRVYHSWHRLWCRSFLQWLRPSSIMFDLSSLLCVDRRAVKRRRLNTFLVNISFLTINMNMSCYQKVDKNDKEYSTPPTLRYSITWEHRYDLIV